MVEAQIAIVTKDRPKILERTLDRLSDLDLDSKVLVIDGSEGDETKEVCQKFNAAYHRQTKDGGRCAARNQALEECEEDYLIYIDDDVIVSYDWLESIRDSFGDPEVVGVTGKLEGEEVSLSGISRKIRDLIYGGKNVFGEVEYNGVINGDFFYNEEKEVDHMVGCNMAFKTETLEEVGGFDESYDVGNSYREETVPSYRASKKGKIIYNPEARLEHLCADEESKRERWLFYNPYLTKYFLHQENIVKGLRNRIEYFLLLLLRHFYFLYQSLARRDTSYLYYLKGEIRGFLDFIIKNEEPKEYNL